jgi:hypothetical protein
MKTRTMLLAAGFALAGLSAANAESGYEPRNGVSNGLTTKQSERILQFSATPRRTDQRTVKPSTPHDRSIHKTRNSGFSHGYSTFDVLDSIR